MIHFKNLFKNRWLACISTFFKLMFTHLNLSSHIQLELFCESNLTDLQMRLCDLPNFII